MWVSEKCVRATRQIRQADQQSPLRLEYESQFVDSLVRGSGWTTNSDTFISMRRGKECVEEEQRKNRKKRFKMGVPCVIPRAVRTYKHMCLYCCIHIYEKHESETEMARVALECIFGGSESNMVAVYFDVPRSVA